MTQEPSARPERRGHPRIAIIGLAFPAVTVLGLQLLIVITCITVVASTLSMAQVPPEQAEASSEALLAVGIAALVTGGCIILAPILALIGLALSVIGYRRRETERTLPTLGIVANGALLFFSCLICAMSVIRTLPELIKLWSPTPPGF